MKSVILLSAIFVAMTCISVAAEPAASYAGKGESCVHQNGASGGDPMPPTVCVTAAEDLMDASGDDRRIQTTWRDGAPRLRATLHQTYAEATPEQSTALDAILDEEVAAHVKRTHVLFVRIYAVAFTESEMQSLAAFYRTPAGHKVAEGVDLAGDERSEVTTFNATDLGRKLAEERPKIGLLRSVGGKSLTSQFTLAVFERARVVMQTRSANQ